MSVKKKGLGKGLSALIPDEPLFDTGIAENNDERVKLIDISLIAPNKEQPRKDFDKESLNELSESVKKHGILQPIIVRKTKDGYEIVAGERRWRAAKEAGFKEVPSLVKELGQNEASQIALIENIQREDLNSIEEAIAYKNLSERYSLTQEEISQAVGKSRSYVTNIMRLLKLDGEVINMISTGKISAGHGRTLLSIEDKKTQIRMSETIMEKELSVRDTEELVKDILMKEKVKSNIDKANTNKNMKKGKDPIILEIEESLRKLFGTKVLISKGTKKGIIEIEYYNDDDLERILEVLSK